jgi:hypothetical protein
VIKIKNILLVCITLILIVGAVFFLIKYFKPGMGGIMVNSTPVSSVYINNALVGKTPYTGTHSAEQISLKLVPEDTTNNLIIYETKINLVAGIKTVIDREFGKTEENSSGDIISFDKTGEEFAGLVVISTPDNSQVLIDGISVGFTPYNFNSITSGSHKMTIRNAGFIERTIGVITKEGLRLSVFAKLARDESQRSLNTSPSPTPLAVKTYILIKDTPTGFLRMRTLPGMSGDEIAELKPGEKYPLLETDKDSGWYKIQYKDPVPGLPDGMTGWVSNQYSTLSTTSASLQ